MAIMGILTTPMLIILIALILHIGLYLYSRSLLFTCTIIGGLSGATLISFAISPIFGFKFIPLSDYWVLIPMVVMYFLGVLLSICFQYVSKKGDGQNA